MRILLGMSGGVDSTYAAKKLIDSGHTVVGAVLVMHEYTETDAARSAAESLNIPIHVIDCKDAFKNIVVENFLDEYLKARTPNPCIICNSEVKFRFLYDYAMENGFDAIATGHYASITKRDVFGCVRYAVCRAVDSTKDQTYMLWRLPQDILSKLVLPLADEEKKEIRKKAREQGIFAADRQESQEICFIPSGNYADFIEAKRGKQKPGLYINNEGKILGEHKGIVHYTVGQRKGLGVAAGRRVFVTRIDTESNTITLDDAPARTDAFFVSDMLFSGMKEPESDEVIELTVKVRYLAPAIKCKMKYLGEGKCRVEAYSSVTSLTPGQSAVFYDGDMLVAGGFISTN